VFKTTFKIYQLYGYIDDLSLNNFNLCAH